jgi:hypothetical protein
LPLLHDQKTIDKCLQNLLRKFKDAEQEDQQVVYEALAPYIKSTFAFSSVLEPISNSYLDHKKSPVLMEYFTKDLSNSILIPNLYLVELAGDLHKSVADDDFGSLVSQLDFCKNDQSTAYESFQLECSILTTAQVLTITNILTSVLALNFSRKSRQVCTALNKALHNFNIVEFKACRLLESWMKWKDSDELSSFAYHAALLLANSNFWSVEATIIVCDLLISENDRFRQRAEMVLRSKSNDDVLTSSKLGLDVLLTLHTKKVHFQYTSPFATLTLYRIFLNIIIDIKSHLDSFLWLERYRIHVSIDRKYSPNRSKPSSISPVLSYFPTDLTMNTLFCDSIDRISEDLIQYMCDLITSQFASFLEIDGDTTSDEVLTSHAQFVVSVLVSWIALAFYNDQTRLPAIDALMTLFEASRNNEIRRAAAYALGYVCDKETSKILFDTIEMAMKNEINDTSNYSDDALSTLISSYSHCKSICNFEFDQDDINLFRELLKNSSQNIVKAAHVGLGRILEDSSMLLEMLDSDYVQCYHALMGSTAYVFIYDVQERKEYAAAELIEHHPDLLSIFLVELYNRIRHFTNSVRHVQTTDFYLAYEYPLYVAVAGLVAVRIPAAFCAYIRDWHDGDDFKRALYYTSKQHRRLERAACVTILSVFGELSVELCEMIIEGLRDDPHIQNICYKCLNRLTSIKDEKKVMNLLFSYLKSKSMNVRYVAVKMLLHLSKSSLISLNQVRTVLNEIMLDPTSNEDLWLIEEQDGVVTNCVYYYAGSLKDVVYSLLVQHLISDSSEIRQRNVFNDINSAFVESEKASRLASCLYEKKTEENTEINKPTIPKVID